MPVVKLNKKVFEQYVGKKLPLEQLKDRISYLGTDLEEANENEIVVEIFPNRPDLLSVQGFSRAFSSFIGERTGLREYKVHASHEKMIIDSSVKDVRPFTAGAIVKNLKFDDEKIKEVIDIQEKLHITYGRNRKKVAIGIYPLEKIRMPIHFLAEDPKKIIFRPLEMDKEMNALEMLEKHPTGKEFAHLLSGKKKFPVFRDANGEVLSVPPIINSHTVGKITHQTKEVFIECSGFDFEIMKKCLNMIVAALSEMGGEIYSMELEYGKDKHITPDMNPEEMEADFEYINTLLGLDLKEKDFKNLFERMGYGYSKKKVLIPAYRTDIIHQADLAEDIAIAYGFENFESIIPKVATIAQENPKSIFKRKIAELLVGLGFLQASTYHLTNNPNQNTKMNTKKECISLVNSISSDYDLLRAWLLPDLMQIFSINKHQEFPQKIFSAGVVFKKNKEFETNVQEDEHLSMAISKEDADYTMIRQVLDYLLRNLDVKAEIKPAEHESFIAGRVGAIILDEKEIGFLGEVHPKVLSNWELGMPVAALELNLEELMK